MASLLEMECRLSNRFALARGESKVKVLVQVRAAGGVSAPEARPLNVALVLDRSTSMHGEALENVKEAARYIVERLREADTLALVAFGSDVEVLVPAQHVADKAALGECIERLRAKGATNLYDALKVGFKEVQRHFARDRVNRVVFLSDGEATAGVTDDEKIVAQAREIGEAGVAVSTLGVGEDYDEVLLGAIAEKTGGNHYFIERPDRIPVIFNQELERLRAIVARDLALTLSLADGVRVKMLNERFRTEAEGNRVVVHFDEMEGGANQAAVLDVIVGARAAGSHRLAGVALAYQDLVGGGSHTLEEGLSLEFVTDPKRIREGVDREVLRIWEELDAVQQLKTIVAQVREGTVDAKTAVLDIDEKTQVLVKRKAMDLAKTFADIGKTILDEGGVSTGLVKKTIVACQEKQKDVFRKTLAE